MQDVPVEAVLGEIMRPKLFRDWLAAQTEHPTLAGHAPTWLAGYLAPHVDWATHVALMRVGWWCPWWLCAWLAGCGKGPLTAAEATAVLDGVLQGKRPPG